MDNRSVPLTIDDVKQLPDFKFARCDYFTVECDLPSSGWTLDLAGRQIPLLMADGAGIIYRPNPKEPAFTTPEQIERLFTEIEEDARFSVGTADVWIPNELLGCIPDKQRAHPRGVTFRVSYDLFIAALQFRTDRLDRKPFEQGVRDQGEAATFSAEEDEAFRAWRRMQVEQARELYPKSDALKLEYKKDAGTSRGKEVQTDE